MLRFKRMFNLRTRVFQWLEQRWPWTAACLCLRSRSGKSGSWTTRTRPKAALSPPQCGSAASISCSLCWRIQPSLKFNHFSVLADLWPELGGTCASPPIRSGSETSWSTWTSWRNSAGKTATRWVKVFVSGRPSSCCLHVLFIDLILPSVCHKDSVCSHFFSWSCEM